MVTISDFITLSYSNDLTQAGIAYGLRSLPYSYPRERGDVPQRLRQVVASKGVELAFKRYLVARGIPHKVWGTARFANPEGHALELGGRECVLATAFLSEKDTIRKVHQTPEALLPAQVAVPSGQVPSLLQVRNMIYVFAFLTALIAGTRQRVARAMEAGQDTCLVHNVPPEKFCSKQGSSLGEVSLKCDTSKPVSITLGGQKAKREFQSVRLTLSPRERLVVPVEFYSLSYLQIEKWPDGVVGLHSPLCKEPYLISSSQWANIWVYGMRIIFVGYLPGETFAREAQRLPPGKRIFPGRKTLVENLVFPVHELRPLQELFDRTREWGE